MKIFEAVQRLKGILDRQERIDKDEYKFVRFRTLDENKQAFHVPRIGSYLSYVPDDGKRSEYQKEVVEKIKKQFPTYCR